jgi:hypothetical protein
VNLAMLAVMIDSAPATPDLEGRQAMVDYEIFDSSNTPPPYDRARFPRVTVYDNVSAQHRLVTERLESSGWRS